MRSPSLRARALSRALPRFLAIVLVGAVASPFALPTATALAQPKKMTPVREELKGDALAAWNRATELFTRQKYDAAQAEYQQAYELTKNPRVLFSVGTCEKARGRYTKAIEIFKREQAEAAGKISKDEEAKLKENIEGLAQFVSTVDVKVDQPGAQVAVDDEPVQTLTPLDKPIDVNIGSRKVTISKTGYATATRTVTVAGRVPATLDIKLEPLVHMARVDVNVVGAPGATIRIDNKEVGNAPYSGQVAVTTEPHVIEALAPGFVTATQSVLVKEGEPLALTLSLSKQQAQGKLKVLARPDGATIEIDGKVVGSDKWEGPVEGGKAHQIVVKKTGFYTWTYDVDVPTGLERAVTAQLNEDRNTSFVPWLIGTIVVVGAGTAAGYFLFRPKDEQPVQGSLSPFTVTTPATHRF